MKRLLVAATLLFIASIAVAIPPPDNATPNSVNISDSISIKFSGVDDIGLAIVWNGNGAETVASCEWTSGGNHGNTRKSVGRYLTKGTNYIIFVLYNKVYSGGFFFAGGKWSGNISISKNGSTFWNVSKHVRNNTRGIKYWKVIKADVSSRGSVSLSERIPSDDLRKLRQSMSELEDKLDQNTGIATPF